jgi:hypothetical protein
MLFINDDSNLVSMHHSLTWVPSANRCYSHNMGKIIYQIKIIEFQMRSLPHAHIVLQFIAV